MYSYIKREREKSRVRKKEREIDRKGRNRATYSEVE